jgi:hypothetical protein
MTLFIKLENGQPVGNPITELTFRRLFTNTSFPKFFTADAVEPLGYGLYDYSNQPELGRYQKVVEVALVRSAAGIWRQTWQMVEMTEAEKSEVDVQQANDMRNKRNYFLSGSDWTQVADAPVDQTAWATYRQSLRDITNHVNFPYLADEDWPVKPD